MTADICNPDIDALIAELHRRECRFLYLKKDGTVREAHGTLATHLIPTDRRPKGRRTPPPSVLTYFDKDRTAWRCLRRERLIGLLPDDS